MLLMKGANELIISGQDPLSNRANLGRILSTLPYSAASSCQRAWSLVCPQPPTLLMLFPISQRLQPGVVNVFRLDLYRVGHDCSQLAVVLKMIGCGTS
jgi:hypothetical protein